MDSDQEVPVKVVSGEPEAEIEAETVFEAVFEPEAVSEGEGRTNPAEPEFELLLDSLPELDVDGFAQ